MEQPRDVNEVQEAVMQQQNETIADVAASDDGGSTSGSEPSDPREFLLQMRRLVLAHKDVQNQRICQTSLEHLIRTTRALVATNQEIWDRCKRYYCGKVLDEVDRSGGKTDVSTKTSNPNYMFVRLAHSTVKARTAVHGTLVFESSLEVTKKSFTLPMAVPSPLNRLVAVPRQPKDEVLPNFALILKRSMLLSEDILVLFLMEFKDHLEKLQIALGEVDAWLLEVWKCKLFLQRYFHNNVVELYDLELKEKQELLYSKRGCFTLLKTTNCSRCGEPFAYHNSTKSSKQGWATWCTCPRKAELPGFFPVSPHATLLIVAMSGTMDLSFSIDQDDDRKRLIKFLSFATSTNTRHMGDEDRQE